MAHYNFKKDLDQSKEAVDAILDYLIDSGYPAFELIGKVAQKSGDIGYLNTKKIQRNIEVKFDIMAEKTGNLCFEMSNGKKPTGIMATLADYVYYVVPNGNIKQVYVFTTSKLRNYIQQPGNARITNGGDRRRFSLALVPINKVVKDKLPRKMFELNA